MVLLVGLQCVAFPDHTNGEPNILLIYYVTSETHSFIIPQQIETSLHCEVPSQFASIQ